MRVLKQSAIGYVALNIPPVHGNMSPGSSATWLVGQ